MKKYKSNLKLFFIGVLFLYAIYILNYIKTNMYWLITLSKFVIPLFIVLYFIGIEFRDKNGKSIRCFSFWKGKGLIKVPLPF